MDNEFITFNTDRWGYDFTCRDCGKMGAVDGEAPVNARVTMMEQGWQFIEQEEEFIPICDACSHK